MLGTLPAGRGAAGETDGVGLLRRTTLAQLADAPFTYPEVGATQEATLPAGYDHVERSAVVGAGRAEFDRAGAAVFRWAAQRGAGLRVRADGPASTPGTVVLMTAGLHRLGLEIPCRVVWAVDEPGRRGFGYGTLPGHPESGEESFVVTLGPGGEVVYTLRAFSRLATPLARLGAPVSRRVQRLALDRYVGAIQRAARTG
ncbi:DUF1990 family protein [Modestobacter marinus]|uniref:DUF1990 domain-containing protein n=1 Tax=Modestobacter marinus TaxID=477641 RepID=A0ABQ2FYY2_9ACTN|nr:hypothetical protein GCM10011589_24230 [Modestobacter marinus]